MMPSINVDAIEPNRSLYAVARWAVNLLVRFGQNLTVEGLENVPAEGSAIIAPNHLSVHDSTVLLGVLPRMVRFIGKAEYVQDWTTRFGFLALGNIPVDRADSESGAAALDAAAAVLQAGDMFGVFPEGTRSRDGLLHRGKTGAARLALRTGASIIPVGLIGTDEMQPPDDPITVMRFRKNVTVRFGEPLSPKRYQDRADQAIAPRQMTDDLMFEIAQLSGQAYVDEYMKRPDELAAEAANA
jgi:1-acyl-sn-glycerol-3-phosphate acyltransferase